jgi:hypothetical protein
VFPVYRLLLFGANHASYKCHVSVGRHVRVLEREVILVGIRSFRAVCKKHTRPSCRPPAAKLRDQSDSEAARFLSATAL